MIETLSWLIRGCFSIATLLSAGCVFLAFATVRDNPTLLSQLRKLSCWSAGIALCLALLWLLVLVAEYGGEWRALEDSFYYELIASSAAADLVILRVVALSALILCVRLQLPAIAGAICALFAVFSFSRYGHALSEPQWARGFLLTVHLVIIAWWFAAVPLLLKQIRHEPAAAVALAQRFGRQAMLAVPVAILAGLVLALLVLSGFDWDFQSLYAKSLLIKLALVSAILGIGALNRHHYFPALNDNPLQATHTVHKVLLIDLGLFVCTLLLSAWLTGPAANG